MSFSGEGLHAYQLNAKKYQSWPSVIEASRLRKMDVRSLHKDHSGDVWVLAKNAILKYAADGSNRRELALPAKTKIRFPSGILQTKNGSIWITTGFQGLAQYFPKNDSLTFVDLPTYPLSKSVQRILARFDTLKLSRGIFTTNPIEDKSGKIWMAAGFNFTQRALQINEGGAFLRFDPLTKK